jgi:hypothetical protein
LEANRAFGAGKGAVLRLTMQLLIRLRRKEREGREVLGAWKLKKSSSAIAESESKGNAIKWLSMIFIANSFDFVHTAHFAVNCMDPA